MLKIIKNDLGNFLVTCLIFLIVTGWIFSGWPRIWQNPPIPPKIQEAQADIESIRPTDAYCALEAWTTPENGYDGNTETSASRVNINKAPSISFGGNNIDETVNAWQTKSQTWDSATLYFWFSKTTGSDDTVEVLITDQNGTLKHTLIVSTTGAVTKQERNQALDSADWGGSGFPNIANLRVRVNGVKTGSPDGATSYMYDVRIDGTYTPANQAPTVDSVSIDPTPTITLNADSTITVTITATITDNDDCEDVFDDGTITAVFYDADTVTDSCGSNYNNCYTNITLSEVGNTCDTGTGDLTGDASVTVPDGVWFHANPGANWTAKVTATDAAFDSGSNTSTVTINTLNAFKLDTSSIPYGTVNPDNVSNQQAVLITTTGNAAIDVQLSGTNMNWSGNEILVGQQKYSATDGFDWESQGTALTDTAACHELSTVKPTEHPSVETENVYWKLKVPIGKPAGGPYTGTDYFEVVSEATCP